MEAGNLWRYEPCVDNVTSFIVGKEIYAQTIRSRIGATVMALAKPVGIKFAMFLNPFAANAVKITQIHRCWYEEISRIDLAQRNLYTPCASMSGVNESS
jgi:hypothetical protein